VTFPAFLDGVVAVGATDRNGNRAAISVTGDKLAIMAPGVDIYSTSYDDKYYRGTGTSASTAIVAGAAALIRSRYPDLPAAEVVHRLTATATDKGAPGRDPEYGYGVLNLVAALTADVPAASPAASPASPVASPAATPGDAATTLPAPANRTFGLILLVVALALAVVGTVVALAVRRRRRGVPAPAGGPGADRPGAARAGRGSRDGP
jgi:subtilisin family serine protease